MGALKQREKGKQKALRAPLGWHWIVKAGPTAAFSSARSEREFCPRLEEQTEAAWGAGSFCQRSHGAGVPPHLLPGGAAAALPSWA